MAAHALYRTRRALASLTIAWLVAAADAHGQEDAGRSAIEDYIWQLQEYKSAVGLRSATPGEGNLYALFDGERFLINAGCGTLQGRYWLNGNDMLFSPHVSSLVRDCPDVLRTQEDAILDLLRDVDRVSLSDDDERLTLRDPSRQRLLIFGYPDKAPLQGHAWQLDAYRNQDGVVVLMPPSPAFTLRFEDAGNLSGHACDDYRAGYERDDSSLRLVGPIAVTRTGCDSSVAGRQGVDYLAVLGGVASYRVDRDELLLRDGDGRMLARFKVMRELTAHATENANSRRRADNLPPAPMPLVPRR